MGKIRLNRLTKNFLLDKVVTSPWHWVNNPIPINATTTTTAILLLLTLLILHLLTLVASV